MAQVSGAGQWRESVAQEEGVEAAHDAGASRLATLLQVVVP